MAEYGKKPVLRAVRRLGFCSRFAFPQQISLLFFGLFMRGNVMKDGHRPMNGAMLVTQGPRCYIRPRAINIIAVTDKNFLVINMSLRNGARSRCFRWRNPRHFIGAKESTIQ